MASKITCTLVLAAAVLAYSWLVPAARAQDEYYMIIFAQQGKVNLPRQAHTFATFIKVPDDDKGKLDLTRIESHTISWLAATMNVAMLRPRAERGVNLNLDASLRLAASRNADVAAWGPYRIDKVLYERALVQIARLDSGNVAYKAMDGGFRPGSATNCFHAVSDLADGPLLNTGTSYGNAVSEMVRDHLSRWIIDANRPHRSLLEPLGLNEYSISFRN